MVPKQESTYLINTRYTPNQPPGTTFGLGSLIWFRFDKHRNAVTGRSFNKFKQPVANGLMQDINILRELDAVPTKRLSVGGTILIERNTRG